MDSAFFSEKRAYSRFPVSIPLSYSDSNSSDTIHIQTHDISAEGLSTLIDKELPVGSYLDICLQMPDNQEKIYRKGKVIWLKAIDAKAYRIGVKLESPPLKTVILVLRVIKARRKY